MLNVIFAEQAGSELILNGAGSSPINIQQTLLHMSQQGMLGFFDKNFKATNLESTALVSIHRFGLPYAGYAHPWDRKPTQERYFKDILPDLFDFVDAKNEGSDMKMAFYSHHLIVEEVGVRPLTL